MARLVNTVTPFLQIYNPATGGFARFHGGLLVIEEGDPNYAVVMAEAARNPSISVMVNSTTCLECGEVFDGKTAAMKLGAHRKEVHFDSWKADKDRDHATEVEREVKSRAGYACDVCRPVQTFGTEEDLAAHVALLHTAPPALDEAGNDVGPREIE